MASKVEPSKCLIWSDYTARGFVEEGGNGHGFTNSPRACGAYVVDSRARGRLVELNDRQRASLTTWLIDQRKLGISCPRITPSVLDSISRKVSLLPHERAIRLLQYLAKKADSIEKIQSIGGAEDVEALAWSESITLEEVHYLLRHLEQYGWISGQFTANGMFHGSITVSGHHQIVEAVTNPSSIQVFVAMWFDPNMDIVFESGIKPAIEDTGYEALRVDQIEHISRIDDRIIAEIRRSRFIVADFTHDEGGARGGVYYEAGFAHGLGIPVIFTCQEDCLPELHFDTNHYNHIAWRTPDELREKLRNRILAAIGGGPRKLQ